MLISGYGISYDPKKMSLVDAVILAHGKYKALYKRNATHVSVHKNITKEERRIISDAMGLIISKDTLGSPMVIAGRPRKGYGVEEQETG